MRRGLLAVLVSLLLFPGSAFAFQFSTPRLSYAVAGIGTFINNLFTPPTVAQHIEPSAAAASAAAATTPPSTASFATPSPNIAPSTPPAATPTATERTVYLQPQTIERTIVQAAPLPNDTVRAPVLAQLLAEFESKISAQIAAITTPPHFPQQVAGGGNGVFSYGAAAAASTGSGGGGSGGASLSDVNSMIASAIQAALAAIDHLTANTITATNANLSSATVTTLHVTGATTLDTPLPAASGGTGISTAPTYGQLLLGQSNGTYALVSTSSLGIPGGTGIWGAVTGSLSNQTDLQNTLNAKLSLAQWYATTTSALAEGSNLYFTTARADARINATSTIGTLVAASNLASVGTVTTGTWNAAAIGIPYGGTGLSAAPSYGQLLIGQSNGTYALVSTSSLGISGGGGSSASSTLLSDANTFSGIHSGPPSPTLRATGRVPSPISPPPSSSAWASRPPAQSPSSAPTKASPFRRRRPATTSRARRASHSPPPRRATSSGKTPAPPFPLPLPTTLPQAPARSRRPTPPTSSPTPTPSAARPSSMAL